MYTVNDLHTTLRRTAYAVIAISILSMGYNLLSLAT